MKKILYLLLFIPFVLNGQSRKISELNAATSVTGTELIPIVQGGVTKSVTPAILNASKLNLADSSATAEPSSYATGNMLEDGLELKLNVANPIATGTLTTPILKVGDAASNTITSLDSIAHVTGATDVNFFDGADTLNPYIPFSKRADIGDVAVLIADSSVFLRESELKTVDDYLIINMSRSANPVITGINGSGGDGSKGVYGQAWANDGENAETYGVYGISNGGGTNNTNIGVYGTAANASFNYAGYFNGKLKTHNIIVASDSCRGTQTKNVAGLGLLVTDATCTLNGLAGGEEGQVLMIVNGTATTLTLKHNGSGTQKFLISGASDLVINAQYSSVTLVYTWPGWFVVGKGY